MSNITTFVVPKELIKEASDLKINRSEVARVALQKAVDEAKLKLNNTPPSKE